MPETAISTEELNVGLTCSDIHKSIHFYTEGLGLGFKVVDKMENGGVLQFVMLRAGAAMIGLGQDDFAKGKDRSKGIGFRMWLNTTQDITALAAHATSAGLKIDDGPKPLPWGPMAFALTDPDGFKITVANPMAR